MTRYQLEQLLEHEGFLRALARRLLRDAARADDLVQETWLVALRSSKRPDEVKRAWLAGILKNLARRSVRTDVRRTRREKLVARRDLEPATDDIADERQVRRRLAALVLGLPERYREPILLRYYDGYTSQRIAEELNVGASTVRTRLQRGLARIRAQLAENGNGNGDRNGGLLSLLPIALTVPQSHPATHALRKCAVLFAALGGLCLCLATQSGIARLPGLDFVFTDAASRATRPGADAIGELASSEKDPAGLVRQNAVHSHLSGRVRLPIGMDPKPVRLEVRAAGMETLRAKVAANQPFRVGVDSVLKNEGPVALQVTVRHPGARTERRTVLGFRDGEGRATFQTLDLALARTPLVDEALLPLLRVESAAEGTWHASNTRSDSGGAADTPDRADAAATVATGPRLRGVVTLPAGASAEPVAIEICRADVAEAQGAGICVRRSATAGALVQIAVGPLLEGALPPALIVRASHPDALPAEMSLTVRVDPRTFAPVLPFFELVLEGGRPISGRVSGENGPIEGATVALFPMNGDEAAERPRSAAVSGQDGSFRLAVEADRRYLLVAAVSELAPAAIVVEPGESPEFELRLEHGAAIAGRVTNQAKSPVDGASVFARVLDAGDRELRLGDDWKVVFDGGEVFWSRRVAESDDDGEFSLGGLRTGQIYALAHGAAGAEQHVTAPGVVNFAVATTFFEIVVVGDGLPLASPQVRLAPLDGGEALDLVADDFGELRFAAAAGTGFDVTVSHDGYSSETRRVWAGGTARFDLHAAATGADMSIELSGHARVPLPATCVVALKRPSGGTYVTSTVGADSGRYRLRDLEPGTYRLHVAPSDPRSYYREAIATITLVAGASAEVWVPLRAGGRVRYEGAFVGVLWLEESLGGAWGRGPDGGFFFGGIASEPLVPDGDGFSSAWLKPGRYLLRMISWDPRVAPRNAAVDVVAGKTAIVR